MGELDTHDSSFCQDAGLKDVFTKTHSLFKFDEEPFYIENIVSNIQPAVATLEDDPFFYETPIVKKHSAIKCHVCGEVFENRSKKFYHKMKFEKGTGCNVPVPKGRPRFETEEE